MCHDRCDSYDMTCVQVSNRCDEEDGEVLTPDFEEDRLQLQSYKGRRQSTSGGCCLWQTTTGYLSLSFSIKRALSQSHKTVPSQKVQSQTH